MTDGLRDLSPQADNRPPHVSVRQDFGNAAIIETSDFAYLRCRSDVLHKPLILLITLVFC